jgi:integrase
MPRTSRSPKYRHYKPKNLAVVRVDGRDVYLGGYGSPESREKYHRLLAERAVTGSAVPPPKGGAGGPSVLEVLVAFLKHADRHYRRPDGSQTTEYKEYVRAFRPVKELYARSPARDFGPRALKACGQALIDSGLSLGVVNQRTNRVRHAFKWAAAAEMIPPSVLQALATVAGLQRGRSGVRATERVKPAPIDHVEAVQPFVSRQVGAIILLQRLTGMRPGEVTVMRACDIDRSVGVWVYRPEAHKMAYADRPRTIFIGPRAQEVLLPWLREHVTGYLFGPRAAQEEWAARRRADRKTPVQPSQRARRKPRPRKTPGDRYTAHSYGAAIRKACEKAGVPPWAPNQLRHEVGTRLRAAFGLDTARAVLGNTSPAVTLVYAERDEVAARAAIERIG